jgi:protein TonB
VNDVALPMPSPGPSSPGRRGFGRRAAPDGGRVRAGAPAGTALARTRMRLALGLGLSLLLHGALALPWLLGGWFEPPPPQRNQLVVDLFGMVSQRQVEQQRAGAEPDKPPEARREQAPPPKPAPKPVPRQAVPRKAAPEKPALQAASPVQVAEPQEHSAEAPAQPSAPPEPAPAAGSARQDQAPQTIQQRDTSEADAIRKYLAGLKKAIQANMVYPAQARELGYTGVPVIRFTLTESGDILPGSLAVHRSSGHAVLDDSALQAVLDSAPRPPPPRRMNVVLDLYFVEG